MSITSYRPKSLSRKQEKDKLRDARLVVIAAEDTYAAKQYFDSDLFQSNRIKIEVLETPNTDDQGTEITKSSPDAVEHRLRNYIEKYDLNDDDILCIMVDRDRWPEKMLSDISRKTFRRKRKNILLAVSNPCFELWLFLHVSEWNSAIKTISSQKMTCMLREKLGSYNKTNLNIDDYRGHVLVACEKARKMDVNPENRWPQTIGTHVYRLIDEIRDFCAL